MIANEAKILVSDDSYILLNKLNFIMRRTSCRVILARDNEECLRLADRESPDLVILDMDMPGFNGIEVCRKIKEREKTSLTPVLVLSGSESRKDRSMAISAGANDYVSKSMDNTELELKVESLLKLNHDINQMESPSNVIKSLTKAVEAKDKYTEGHAERVSTYAVRIAKQMGLSKKQIKNIHIAGIMHDIGKIGIPDVILNKPGKLTQEEFEIIKHHPAIGDEICAPIKAFESVRNIIRHHHEKLNGKGYPDGIAGKDIDIETRIMVVADIYDALTSDRAYRKGMNMATAFQILHESVDKGENDLNVVRALEDIILHSKRFD